MVAVHHGRGNTKSHREVGTADRQSPTQADPRAHEPIGVTLAILQQVTGKSFIETEPKILAGMKESL